MSNVITTVDFSSKKWLAQKVVPSCKDTTGCAWTYSTYTSTVTKNDERSRYDVNIRSIITFGEIRCGLSHIETCHVMERFGLHTGHFNVEASRFAELVRISGVGYKATENVKIRRKKLHAQKKVMIMSITRIMGQGCIKYTFCTIYFRL